MMIVKAKHNIQYGDKWIAGGTTFEASEAEYKELREYVEKAEDAKSAASSADRKDEVKKILDHSGAKFVVVNSKHAAKVIDAFIQQHVRNKKLTPLDDSGESRNIFDFRRKLHDVMSMSRKAQLPSMGFPVNWEEEALFEF